jgi:hypothetical protein
MASSASYVVALEFKHRRVDAPMVDQIVGAAQRNGYKDGRQQLRSVVIYCRGMTEDAEQRAADFAQKLGIAIHFNVIGGNGDAG